MSVASAGRRAIRPGPMETVSRYVLPGASAACVATALFTGDPRVQLFAWVGAAVFACAFAIARSTRVGVLLTALGCMGSNLYLLTQKWAASGKPSLCTVDAVVNCDALNTSSYSMLLDTPVTVFGAAFYLGLAIAAFGKPTARFHQVNTIFAVLSLAMSAYLAAASYSLGAVCAMCVSIYAGNILLFIAGIKGLRESDVAIGEELGEVFRSSSFWTVSGVFLVMTVLGRTAWDGRDGASAASVGPAEAIHTLSPSERIGMLYAKPDGPVTLDGTEPILGDPNAPYMVVEWADFGCPHCAHASKAFKVLVAEHPDVQVRFKAFPLSGACNPLIDGDGGAERCVGALAAECAGRQGKFWEMSGTMFQNLGYLAAEDLEFMAGQVGVDVPTWRACLQDTSAQESVIDDAKAGVAAGVQGTPALYLKGTHGDDFVLVLYTPEEVDAILEAHRSGMSLPPPGPAPRR